MNLNQYWKQGVEKTGLEYLCCGCGTCEQVCPKSAISMNKREDGFFYPVIDEDKCVECGVCVHKCQCLSDDKIINTDVLPKVYAAVNKDLHSLKNSSSGGMAYVLSEFILNQNGAVFGAVYTDSMDIVHEKIKSIDDLWRLQGSKYAQSVIGKTYEQVKECLVNGQPVLFTGTPCQIGGLYHYLGKDYPKLYTMDIICYGASSPGIFKEYIIWKQQKTKGIIKNINFRSKLDKWGNSITIIEYKDRRKVVKYSDEDEWYQVFISHLATRESCHYCKYTNLQRMSDITVGDYWGIEKFRPDIECDRGLSKVLVNTSKGMNLLSNIKKQIICEEMTTESAIRPNLEAPPHKRDNRDTFIRDYCQYGFYKAYTIHVKKKISVKRRIKLWVKIKIKCMGEK